MFVHFSGVLAFWLHDSRMGLRLHVRMDAAYFMAWGFVLQITDLVLQFAPGVLCLHFQEHGSAYCTAYFALLLLDGLGR